MGSAQRENGVRRSSSFGPAMRSDGFLGTHWETPSLLDMARGARICGQCQVDDHIHVGNAKGVLLVCFILDLLSR